MITMSEKEEIRYPIHVRKTVLRHIEHFCGGSIQNMALSDIHSLALQLALTDEDVQCVVTQLLNKQLVN